MNHPKTIRLEDENGEYVIVNDGGPNEAKWRAKGFMLPEERAALKSQDDAGAEAAPEVHTLTVEGSTPSPATTSKPKGKPGRKPKAQPEGGN